MQLGELYCSMYLLPKIPECNGGRNRLVWQNSLRDGQSHIRSIYVKRGTRITATLTTDKGAFSLHTNIGPPSHQTSHNFFGSLGRSRGNSCSSLPSSRFDTGGRQCQFIVKGGRCGACLFQVIPCPWFSFI